MLFLFMICTFRVGFNDGGMGFDTYLLTDDILLENVIYILLFHTNCLNNNFAMPTSRF